MPRTNTLKNPDDVTTRQLWNRAFNPYGAGERKNILIERTPRNWSNFEAMYDEILAIYKSAIVLSYALDAPYSVRHIFPLRGATVSGLHTPDNLEIVPARVALGVR